MTIIADSGATKTSWVICHGNERLSWQTDGISPYFFSEEQIAQLVKDNLLLQMPEGTVDAVYFYGTGCATPQNQQIVRMGLQKGFDVSSGVEVQSDLMAAARALCGRETGVACILGTGSNSGVFDGQTITRNNPAPGFILGDEGSGAYLGRKVLQYFIYQTFDDELMHKFNIKYNVDYRTILDHVYKQPWPNRYLASFAPFLSENRGHYMVENIIEDGLVDFFHHHLFKYPETWQHPINFVGSIAWHFSDVLTDLCKSLEVDMGKVLKEPMPGLIEYHNTTPKP